MENSYKQISRTDKVAQRDHIHVMVPERYEDTSGVYRYRCQECGARLKRKSGVMARAELPEIGQDVHRPLPQIMDDEGRVVIAKYWLSDGTLVTYDGEDRCPACGEIGCSADRHEEAGE